MSVKKLIFSLETSENINEANTLFKRSPKSTTKTESKLTFADAITYDIAFDSTEAEVQFQSLFASFEFLDSLCLDDEYKRIEYNLILNASIDYYQNKKQEKFDYLIYLQPTSPLRNERHIDEAIEFMFEKKANAIVSVCELEHPVQWSGLLPEDRDMSNFIHSLDIKTRSQDFPTYYRLNGAIFICDTDKFMKSRSVFLKENIFAYVMPQHVSIDIDLETDFIFAKSILDNHS